MERDAFAAPPWFSVRRAWIAMVLGVILGFFDFWLLGQLGVTTKLGDQNVTWAVSTYFAANFGILAFLLGYASEARRRLRRQAETIQTQYEALQQSQRRAAENERRAVENEKLAAVGRLAACVAHEVRNPLGVIRTSASMMMEEFPMEDDRWRAGEFICEEVIRLDAFCTALLNFSRPVALEMREVPIVDVIASIQRRVASSWEGADEAQISTELPDEALMAEVDQELLTQACLGLTENAVQAVGAEGRVIVRAHQKEGADALCIEVADDGPGVASEMVRKIFEPFFTTKASGTGLGLAMSARIAEAHKGTLELVDARGAGPGGSGACFRLTIPLRGG